MSDHQITYEDSSFELLFDFPIQWDVDAITSVTLTIEDYSGNELLAATAATLWDGVIEEGEDYAVGDYPMEIDVTDDPDDVDPREGCRYRIVSSGGIVEDVVCARWENKATYDFTIHLKEELKLAHTAGDTVKGCYAVKSVDFSDTDDYPRGKTLRLIWTPDSDDAAVVETAVVGSTEFAQPDISKAGTSEPLNAETIRGGFNGIIKSHGVDPNRVVGDEFMQEMYRRYAEKMQLSRQGDRAQTEYDRACKLWDEWFSLFTSRVATWVDADQDGIQDPYELMMIDMDPECRTP